jgi:5-methyltetrahydropteroyltriglutamate--homocysteine methyltransferase
VSDPLLRASLTGSMPKPTWLAEPGVLFAPWRVAPERLVEAQDDAVRLAIADQEAAGLDVVTDGEARRRHYIWGFLEGLTGIDTETLGTRLSRGGRYVKETRVARIVGEVTRPVPVLVAALRFAKLHATRPVKVTLPGPMTTVDSLLDEHYRVDERELALRFAAILNAEAHDLAAAGADVIQVDEPCFNIYVDKVRAWGIEALDRVFDGVAATRAVHICYGYGIPRVLAWKKENRSWGEYAQTLPLLAASSVHQVSVECAASGVDPAVLRGLGGAKDVLLGVIDVGTEDVEPPEVVARRIEAALPHVPPERIIASTDCGLVPRSRAAARGKLAAIVRGAALARAHLGRAGG